MAAATLVTLGIGGLQWQEGGLWRPLEGSSNNAGGGRENGTNSSSRDSAAGYRHGLPWLSSLLASSQTMATQPEPLYATGETTTAAAAEIGPVVMDGRGTALPMVVDHPPTQPLSISAWVLVYCPPIRVMDRGFDKAVAGSGSSSSSSSSSNNNNINNNEMNSSVHYSSTRTTSSWLHRPPREMTLLSFGRPAFPPSSAPTISTSDTSTSSAFREPAPSIHLSVGKSNASLGRLFFSGTADCHGALMGFHSLAPLPLNRWVHVGLVLTPLPSPEEEGMMWGRKTGKEGGMEGRKKGRVALSGYMDGDLQGRLELEVDVWDAAAAAVEEVVEGEEGEKGKEAGKDNVRRRQAANRRRRALHQQQVAQQRKRNRAVLVWGGVRARREAMLTGLLQHARVYVNQSLTTPQIHEIMNELPPWPVPSRVAGPLGLAPYPTPRHPAAAAAAAEKGWKEDVGTQWVEEAVALLHENGEVERGGEEERKRLAHWYLSGAVLLHADDGVEVAENEKEEVTAVASAASGSTSSTSSSSSSSSNGNDGVAENKVPADVGTGGSFPGCVLRRLGGWWRGVELYAQLQQAWCSVNRHRFHASFKLGWARGGLEGEGKREQQEGEEEEEEGRGEGEERFVLPGASSAHLAQLILASQALHGLDRARRSGEGGRKADWEGSVLDPAFLRRYGEQVVVRQQDVPTSRDVLFPSSCSSSSRSSPSFSCSPKGCVVAVAHYLSLAETATTSFGFEFRHAGREVRREVRTEESLFPASLTIKNVEELLLREEGEEEEDRLFSFFPSLHQHPFEQQQQANNPWHDDELEYLRVKAEGGKDPEAMAWYAQALYYGQHGAPPDRAAAQRMMERAAELGHPEAQYNAGVMLLQGEGGGAGAGAGAGREAGVAGRAARIARAGSLWGGLRGKVFFRPWRHRGSGLCRSGRRGVGWCSVVRRRKRKREGEMKRREAKLEGGRTRQHQRRRSGGSGHGGCWSGQRRRGTIETRTTPWPC